MCIEALELYEKVDADGKRIDVHHDNPQHFRRKAAKMQKKRYQFNHTKDSGTVFYGGFIQQYESRTRGRKV